MAKEHQKKDNLATESNISNNEDQMLEINADEADFGEVFAAWQFPEFIKHQRGKWWYILFVIILVGLLIFAWFDRNITFATLLVLIFIIYLNLEKKEILQFDIAITEDGILLNNKLLEYNDLNNFYIVYYPPQIKNLYLQPKNFWNTIMHKTIIIPLEDQDPVLVRQALLQYLPEDLAKEHMPTTEAIARLIKF